MIFLESVGSRASLSAERDAKASFFLSVNQQVVKNIKAGSIVSDPGVLERDTKGNLNFTFEYKS
jgi:hypothetical protein